MLKRQLSVGDQRQLLLVLVSANHTAQSTHFGYLRRNSLSSPVRLPQPLI